VSYYKSKNWLVSHREGIPQRHQAEGDIVWEILVSFGVCFGVPSLDVLFRNVLIIIKINFLHSGGGHEELDGREVNALGVLSWKLSTGLNGQS
jgi:hypothetical protein